MDPGSGEVVPDSIRGAIGVVTQLLLDGDVEQAERIHHDAIKHWPHAPKLLLLKGDILARTSSPQQAALHYADLLDDPKVATPAANRLIAYVHKTTLALSDALELAQRVCDAKIDPIVKDQILHNLLERTATAEQDRVLEILGRSSCIFKYEWKSAVRHTERSEFDVALPLLENARSQGRGTVKSAVLLSDLYAVCSRLPDAIALLEELLNEDPEQPDIYRRLTMLLQRAGRFSRAADIFESAVRRWPHDWMLIFRLNRLPIERQRLSHIFDLVAAGADTALETNDRFRYQFAIGCLHTDRVAQGQDLLMQPFQQPVASQAEPVLKALGARSPHDWVSGSRLVDDRTQEVQIVKAANARATVIVPTGIAFGNLPLSFIDTLFAAHNLNVIYLRDYGKHAYLRGIATLGQSEQETIDALARITRDLGAKRTIVMGCSSGGLSALRYGALMQADFAISFAGPTTLASVYEDTKKSVWNPNLFVRAMIQQQGDLPLDLVPLLSKPGRTKFRQYFGAGDAEDVRQARRIEGLPGVELISVPGIYDHFVIDHMIGDGSFDALLEELSAA